MEQKLIEQLNEQLKNFLDDYEDSLRHNTGRTKEELDLLIDQLEKLENTLLPRIASLKQKSRVLSLMEEV
jgi:polyhydroxyalkanoate synthesis regulator phasin